MRVFDDYFSGEVTPLDSLWLLSCSARDARTERRYLVKYLEYSSTGKMQICTYYVRAYE